MGVKLPLLQSVGTSPDRHDLSKMMESGLASASAMSLRTRVCISSGPLDLYTFRFLRQSQTWSSPTAGGSSFSQSLTLPSVSWVVWLEHLLLKTEAKKSFSTSAFSTSQVTRSPASFQRGPTFSLVFLLSVTYL